MLGNASGRLGEMLQGLLELHQGGPLCWLWSLELLQFSLEWQLKLTRMQLSSILLHQGWHHRFFWSGLRRVLMEFLLPLPLSLVSGIGVGGGGLCQTPVRLASSWPLMLTLVN